MKQPHPRPLLVTAGEPGGIGPDLCIQLAQQQQSHPWVVVSDPELLQQRASILGLPVQIHRVEQQTHIESHQAGHLYVLPVSLHAPARCGKLNPDNAPFVLETLDIAIAACQQGHYAGIVTAPLHKGIINEAGIPFTGHTEYLAQKTNTSQVVMMLATEGLRVALVTTHLPLSQVSQAITPSLLSSVVDILNHDLQTRLGIEQPNILVCGLNPHAGEGGHMGREEIEIIEPVLERKRVEGMKLFGPLPADTLFTPRHLQNADAVLAMYHDQGLPVLKHMGFGNAVNVTLGLPIIRTSVDHGTALHLAGTGKADIGSLQYAMHYAVQMIQAGQVNA
ncbi:MAG: 4-hydroxythreonine-4-phosphate dehydrogenase PdxA [Gammaproteobacteria bacterium]|nr:4-hydroxythreonine-4-phosphate dehydrogenase PdxA [Gammaproteobacteria bacterium]